MDETSFPASTARAASRGIDRALLFATSLFVAFVLIGGLGGWRWWLRDDARPLELVQQIPHTKHASNPF